LPYPLLLLSLQNITKKKQRYAYEPKSPNQRNKHSPETTLQSPHNTVMAGKLAFTLTSPRVLIAPIQKPFISSSSSLPSPSCSSSTRVHFNVKQFSLRRRMLLPPTKATADQQAGLCHQLF